MQRAARWQNSKADLAWILEASLKTKRDKEKDYPFLITAATGVGTGFMFGSPSGSDARKRIGM